MKVNAKLEMGLKDNLKISRYLCQDSRFFDTLCATSAVMACSIDLMLILSIKSATTMHKEVVRKSFTVSFWPPMGQSQICSYVFRSYKNHFFFPLTIVLN